LPALSAPAPGEQRMLEQSGTAAFAEQIRKPKHVARHSS
jgi:hypothetical protein